MIYTVTLNPALDYAVYLEHFTPGATNRTNRETLSFGGKGINVSAVLASLGEPTVALGFVAGATGRMLKGMLKEASVAEELVTLDEGQTRINVKIKGEVESEINATGPVIDEKAMTRLLDKLTALRTGDTLVLAGSIPPSAPQDCYERIVAALAGRDIRLVLDMEREWLLPLLRCRPFLIKPNRAELARAVERELNTETDVIEAARYLQERGAGNVLVSLGADGALLLDEEGKLHRRRAAEGTPVNTVGAGDSMVAGFLYGYNRGPSFALRMGVAAGGATACSEGLGTAEEIARVLRTL